MSEKPPHRLTLVAVELPAELWVHLQVVAGFGRTQLQERMTRLTDEKTAAARLTYADEAIDAIKKKLETRWHARGENFDLIDRKELNDV